MIDSFDIDRWLEIAIIGADPVAAATIVDLIARGVVDLESRGETVEWFLAGLRALLQGDRGAAATAAESLGRWLEAPATDPSTARYLAGLDLLIGATASGDQAAFDQGVAVRRQGRVAAFGRSVQLRRNPDGLLDAAGAAVARLAVLRGRSLPPGDPYLATELLAAMPWPRTGADMGYTAELWAVPPTHVLGALAAAHPVPPDVPMPDETRETWAQLAGTVGHALRQGGGRLVPEYSLYVASVVRAVGHYYGSLAHSSSGGETFRRRFLAGPAAAPYGRDAVSRLFVRDLGGLIWEEYPTFGHLTAPEVAAVAEQVRRGPPQSPDPDDVGQLLVLDGALTRAARFGLELHVIYG